MKYKEGETNKIILPAAIGGSVVCVVLILSVSAIVCYKLRYIYFVFFLNFYSRDSYIDR